MPINGLIFDNRVPTAKGFRNGLHAALTDGVLNGCDITISSGVTTIGSGYIIIAGGIFKIEGSISVNTGSEPMTYARVIATFDPSKTSTETAFEQIEFSVDYSNTLDGFPQLVQSNVNGSESIGTYSAEIAIINNGTDMLYRKKLAHAKHKYIDWLAPGDNTTKHTITIGSGGYAGVESPSELPVHSSLITVSVLSWSTNASNPGPFSLLPYENGNGKPYVYVMGTPGVKIDNLRLRYWYL